MRYTVRWTAALLLAGAALVAACTAAGEKAPATAPAWQAPATAESIEVVAQRKLTDFRLWAPRIVVGDTARFTVDVPERAVDADGKLQGELMLIVGPEGDAEPPLQGTTHPSDRGSYRMVPVVFESDDYAPATRPATQPASQPATAPATTTAATRPARRPPPLPQAKVVVADLAPGVYKAMLMQVRDADRALAPAGTATFRVMPRLLDGLPSAQREEVATWIDDWNENLPIWGKVPAWRNLTALLARLEKGETMKEDPFAAMRGFVLRSYFNPQWQRRQAYTAYVPESLDLSQEQPLLIVLHGSGGDYRNIVADEAAGQRFENFPMLVANAGAYRNQEYRHMALNDVKWIIEDMAAKYKVDRSRIYLQGISLGGRGTMELAALMPDTFAAVSAQGSYGIQSALADPGLLLQYDPVALAYAARSDIRTWLPNLRNTPVELIIGMQDDTTPPAGQLLFGELLKSHGTTVRVREFATGHNISMPDYDWASTREWMLTHRKNPEPHEVFHRVSNLRYGRNAWVHVRALTDYAGIGEVQATYEPDTRTLQLALRNVTLVSLHLPGPVEQVVFGGKTMAPKLAAGEVLHVFIKDGQAQFSTGAVDFDRALASFKRAGVSGPMWDVFSERVVYVYDTSMGEAVTERLKTSAKRSAEWDVAFGDPSLPVLADTELTDDLRRNANVIYFTAAGGRSLADERLLLPQAVETLAKDRQADFRAALRPSPWRKDGYLLLVQVDAADPIALHAMGWWDAGMQADWIVGKRTVSARGRGRVEFVAAGAYGANWTPTAGTAIDFRSGSLLGPGSRR